MSGGGTQTTTQQGQQTTSPWAPAIPYLTNILGQTGNANLGPTSLQTGALQNLYNQAGAVGSGTAGFAGGASNIINQMLNYGRGTVPGTSGKVSGYGTLPQQRALAGALGTGTGMLESGVSNAGNLAGGSYEAATGMIDPTLGMAFSPITNAYNTAEGSLSPYLSSNFLDPNNNPYFKQTMDAIGQQSEQATNSLFAAAGRDPAGNAQAAKAGSIAMANALAPYAMGQFNTDIQAQQNANSLLGNLGLSTGQELGSLGLAGAGLRGQLGLGTAGLLGNLGISGAEGLGSLTQGLTGAETAQQMQQFNTGLQGAAAAQGLPGLYTTPGQAQLTAANALAGSPIMNLGALASLTDPIAGLGGTNIFAGTSQTQLPFNLMSNLLGGGLGLLSLGLPGAGAGSGIGGGTIGGSLFSSLFPGI